MRAAAVVGRADPSRPGLVLGLPAPGQPAPGRDRRRPGLRRRSPPPRTPPSVLHDFGARVDPEADVAHDTDAGGRAYQWSFALDLGRTRLVMLDNRCSRVLTAGHREMLPPGEWAWFLDQAHGDYDHLVIGSSLPWLLPPAHPPPRGLERAARRLRPARAAPRWRSRSAARSTWSTGRRSAARSTRWRSCSPARRAARGRARRPGRRRRRRTRPRLDQRALRRRAPLVRGPGRSAPRRARHRCTSSPARRSTTRCRPRCGR